MTDFEWIGLTGVAIALATWLFLIAREARGSVMWDAASANRATRLVVLAGVSGLGTTALLVGPRLFGDDSRSALEWVLLSLGLTLALGAALAGLILEYRLESRPEAHVPESRRRRAWPLAAFGALIVAAVVALVLLLAPPDLDPTAAVLSAAIAVALGGFGGALLFGDR